MKKKILILCLLLVTVFAVIRCSGEDTYFGFRTKDFTVIQTEDTHGGFQGEGTTSVILDCSENREKALELVAD